MDVENENDLLLAVHQYYKSLLETNKCTDMLLSYSADNRPSQIMQDMYDAQSKMFKCAGIEYHGGK